MQKIKSLGSFLVWRVRNINYRTFVLILSFLVGILSGISAVLLKTAVHYTNHFLTHRLNIETVNYLYFAYPFIGILFTVIFVKFFVKDKIGHGISRILFAISRKNSLIRPHNTYSSMIASTLTVGFGGSVGLEAPIVLTGSSIGSNIGRKLKLNYKTTTLLIGCGAAGAIAGIFKAPIAAVVFALEVLMLDLTMWSLVPLLISAVSGAMVSYVLSGKEFIFSVDIEKVYSLHNLPYYALLGIFCGFVSFYFTRGTIFIENKLGQVNSPYKKLFIGGALLGVLIFLFPPLYGEGYNSLMALLNGHASSLFEGSAFYGIKDNFMFFTLFFFLIIIFKVAATALTNGSGGVGGIFAPTLFMGGITGFIVAKLMNLFAFINVSEKKFALVGMAGLMAGIMHAPLTAIFLIAEITGGYFLFVPLIVTATLSYITITLFESHSIYTHRLAQRGQLITHDKDIAVLRRLNINRVIERDLMVVRPNTTLGELVKTISRSKRNIFPVVDEDGSLEGVVQLDNIRDIIFNREMYDKTYVENLLELPPTVILFDEPMENVLNKFESTGVWNLPVIRNGKYEGFISKSKLFSIYRKRLKDISDD